MFRRVALVSLLALSAAASAQTAPAIPELPADQAAMRAHVMFLASDAMKGREAGSPEYDIAAQYVASQFYAAGLKPAGDNGGYLQKVPLVSYKAADEGSFVWTPRGGQPVTLTFGEDFAPSPVPDRAETSLSAPVVFVGYGIDAPQYGQNDYKGADVRGKIVAFAPGTPAGLGGEERAFFGSAANKAALAAARGAVGAIQLVMPGAGGKARPFSARGYDRARVGWANPDGTVHSATPGTPILGTLSAAGAAKLFGKDWDAIAKAAAAEAPRYKPVTAKGALTVALKTSVTPMPSSNVIGMIPGSDPKLKDQVVVLSAHLDHIGVNEGGDGDRINNGALDNAIGIASLIEEAKRFKESGKPPRRSVMFLAVTAEEKGLVGSDYFANNPTVPLKSIVADVNLDMPILTYTFEDMIVFGAERSTLGPIVRKAVGALGLPLSPDPMPEEGIFVRSDHFRFVQKGIPSVFLWPGQKGPGAAAVKTFMSTNYHRPSDDLSLPIDWSQGPRFVGVNYAIAREIADGDARPVWNKGDYFGTLYKGPMAAK
ncbi:M28 family peptidase [Sphingomonas sp.]|uniref:M28 family peptidase n=1 Tax=Sphingomonas sp. TaxID=28214 RepID=UPI0035B1EA05